MHSGIASIPLDADETMQVGYIMHNERRPSDLLLRYIDELHAIIGADPTVEPVSYTHLHASSAGR